MVAGVRWAAVVSLGPLAPYCASTDLSENPSISKGELARTLASCLDYLHADQRSTGGVICTAQGSLGSCPCGEQQCLDAPIMRLGGASTLPHAASACSIHLWVGWRSTSPCASPPESLWALGDVPHS